MDLLLSRWKRDLIVLLLAGMAGGCVGEVEVCLGSVSGVNLKNVHGKSLTVDVTINIENHSPRKIIVRKLHSDIYIGTQKAGNITTEEKVVIPPFSNKNYIIPLKIEHEDVLAVGKVLLVSLLREGGIRLQMTGTMHVRSGIFLKKIRFDEKDEVPLLR